MKAVDGNQPSVSPAPEPTALHACAVPSQRATWSACTIPDTFKTSVPTYTSVPLAVRLWTRPSSAHRHGPALEPISCHALPVKYATLSAAWLPARLFQRPPAYRRPSLSAVRASTGPPKNLPGGSVDVGTPLLRSHATSSRCRPSPGT